MSATTGATGSCSKCGKREMSGLLLQITPFPNGLRLTVPVIKKPSKKSLGFPDPFSLYLRGSIFDLHGCIFHHHTSICGKRRKDGMVLCLYSTGYCGKFKTRL